MKFERNALLIILSISQKLEKENLSAGIALTKNKIKDAHTDMPRQTTSSRFYGSGPGPAKVGHSESIIINVDKKRQQVIRLAAKKAFQSIGISSWKSRKNKV